MANHSREDLENNSNAQTGIGIAAILGGIIAAGVGIANASSKQSIKNRISEIDSRINDLESGLLGSWLNGDEIQRLKAERAELYSKLNGE